GTLGDLGADVAEADDAQRLAANLDPGVLGTLPLASANRSVSLRDPAGAGHEQGDRVLGRRRDVAARGVDNQDAAPRCRVHVDVVDADSRAADDPESLAGLH